MLWDKAGLSLDGEFWVRMALWTLLISLIFGGIPWEFPRSDLFEEVKVLGS